MELNGRLPLRRKGQRLNAYVQPRSRMARAARYSTSCRSSPIRTLFTNTMLLLISSCVVIVFSTKERMESMGHEFDGLVLAGPKLVQHGEVQRVHVRVRGNPLRNVSQFRSKKQVEALRGPLADRGAPAIERERVLHRVMQNAPFSAGFKRRQHRILLRSLRFISIASSRRLPPGFASARKLAGVALIAVCPKSMCV